MSSQGTKSGGFHYAFLIVIACCVMCGICAVMVNTAGIFLPSVSAYFGISSVAFMLYFTILCLTMVVALPIGGKLLDKFKCGTVFTGCAILCALGAFLMSRANAIWVFYVGGVLEGLGTAPMLFLAVPKLIGNWCEKRVGFLTGLCLAFTGLGAVIFNPILTAVINTGVEGWRTAYIVETIAILVCVLPFSLFVIKDKPEDKGLKPYGAGEVSDDNASTAGANLGVSSNKAMKTPAFFCIAIFGGIIALNQTVYQFLPRYCISFQATAPEIAALSGTVAAVCMAGLTVGKIVLGAINDKSPKLGVLVSIVCGIVGILVMWMFPTVAALLIVGAFLFGFVYAATTVETTLLTRAVFGNRDYATIYSRISTVSALGGALGATILGVIVDMPNGFSIMFVLSLAIMVIACLLAMFSLAQSSKYERTAA